MASLTQLCSRAGRREGQFERFYLILLDAAPTAVTLPPFAVGKPDKELQFSDIVDDVLNLVAGFGETQASGYAS